ncbi:cell wall-binding repeat-containing protein [Zhihengliuella salsuginis]|uniref:N-acetylmuramoyl-L-alanine amidase n=1 Tax=Zhihengliuella salsuginis TaxID=578222 RepID=A0ABQ3GI48_9MICC|nr:cell wall-binding repeat-containing protein [Zhihengliuella salsuginis]GHD08278.1 hypothetical protein GCM10008096_19770 [Zhihengliuella salsuginis]
MRPSPRTLAVGLATLVLVAAGSSPVHADEPAAPTASTTEGPGIPEGPGNPAAELDELSAVQEADVVSIDASPSAPVVVSISWEGPEPHAQYRVLTGESWGDWAEVPSDSHDGPDDEAHGAEIYDPLAIVNAEEIQIRPTAPDANTESLTVEAYASEVTDVDRQVTQAGIAKMQSSTSNSVLQQVIPRESWGARAPVCDLGNADQKHATIIHHTAGSNAYEAWQVPSILRGIQNFHIAKNPTWCDIGYHMLVDKFGNIYEGRGGGVTKARIATHAAGWNSDTFGVSVLGDYRYAKPTWSVRNSLTRIVAWQAKYWGYDPAGKVTLTAGGGGRYPAGQRVTINRVIGHRDVGYTTCPGDNIYTYLTQFRSDAGAYMKYEEARRTVSDTRLSGDTRYTTSVEAAQRSHPNGAKKVYIATGENYADALVAAPAAAHRGAALLLTKSASVPSEVLAEVRRLNPSSAVIVGGTGAVSRKAAAQIDEIVPTVVRHSGADRYETATAVIRGAFPSANRAYAVTGGSYPDALSAAAVAGSEGAPVILVRGSSGSAGETNLRTLRSLGVSKVVVVGGPAIVSRAVADSLREFSPYRVYGADRYATNHKLNAGLVSGASEAYFATGYSFPDAISGAAVAGTRDAPLYLAKRNCIAQQARADILDSSVSRLTLLGGSAIVHDSVGDLEPCF